MVNKEKIDLGIPGYILGIISIIFGVITPVAGLITGIIGLSLSKKEKTELAKRGKKLNTIGIIVSIIVLVILIVSYIYSIKTNIGQFQNFPVS